MCGFLGTYGNWNRESLPLLRERAALLRHRGNSGYGEHIDHETALFHHRLAFRDLAGGKQPMASSCGRARIVFNGELYGYQPLRDRLSKTYEFHGRSDTEVLLAAQIVQGENMLDELDGEYAFGLWRSDTHELWAARDFFGVKPLFLANESLQRLGEDFFRENRDRWVFRLEGPIHLASEMKALPLDLRWNRRGLARQILGLYEEISTAFENVVALPPGALLRARRVGNSDNSWECILKRKISTNRTGARSGSTSAATEATAAAAVIPTATSTHGSAATSATPDFWECARELRHLVSENVRRKLDSEVPLGAYLSGGVDSRIAAYEMSRVCARGGEARGGGGSNDACKGALEGTHWGEKIHTFTVGFEDPDFDETGDVRKFLSSFPALQGQVLRTTNAALEYAYPHALWASELVQPYTNGAAKWWLSRFARRTVRGVLTGDGSDELFCGYPSYRYLAWWRFWLRHPSAARASLYPARMNGKKFWEQGLSSRSDGSDLSLSMNALGWAHPLYEQVSFMAQLFGDSDWIRRECASLLSYARDGSTPLERWQNYFLHTHFPTHVLNWVGDRMEMANTLEGRPIFLSRSVLEFVRTLPDHFLVRGQRDKAVLRAAWGPELASFARAPKKQFNAPFLADGALARDLLSDANVRAAGLVDPLVVARTDVARRTHADPLHRSFAAMLWQNLLVTHFLDRHLVKRRPPERDLAFEEKFLDEHSGRL